MSSDVIEKLIEKERKDITEAEMRRHPYEFQLYFDL